MRNLDSEDYVEWRRRRTIRRKRFAYAIIVISLIAIVAMMIIGK